MHSIAIVLIALILSLTTELVVDKVIDYKMIELESKNCKEGGYRPPSIPVCKKELWKRITEGCEDDKD